MSYHWLAGSSLLAYLMLSAETDAIAIFVRNGGWRNVISAAGNLAAGR